MSWLDQQLRSLKWYILVTGDGLKGLNITLKYSKVQSINTSVSFESLKRGCTVG